MAVKYVKEFEFPADCGFTGSSSKSSTKNYARGGEVMGKADGGMAAGSNMRGAAPAMMRAAMESKKRPMRKPMMRRGADMKSLGDAMMASKGKAMSPGMGGMSDADKLAMMSAKKGYKEGGMAMTKSARKGVPAHKSEPMFGKEKKK
jgi:hypothetical protein